MIGKPPKIVTPGLNRGAGIPDGVVLGRRRGVKQGPVELLDLKHLTALGLATTAENTKAQSGTASTAQSSTDSLSKSVSTSLSQISSSLSTTNSQVTSLSTAVSSVDSGQNVSLSQISSSLSGAISSTSSLSSAVSTVDSNQSISLSQVSSSLSGAISSTTSLSSAVSTVISGSISTVNSRIDSLSTAGGGGGATTFLALTDTPASYVGQAAKVVRVNAGETALEFAAGSVDPGQSTSLSQISSSLSGAISSTTSLSSAVSTVDSNQSTSLSQISSSLSTEISVDLSRINSLSTALAGASGTAYEAGPITAPLVASFSWLNQGTSTATDGTGALILQPQVNAQLHSLIKSVPTTPFDIYCRVEVEQLSNSADTTTDTVLGGIVLRNSANGDVVSFCVGCDRDVSAVLHPYTALQRWTASGATFSANLIHAHAIGLRTWRWLRFNVTSTTITAYSSFDGKNWILVGTDTIASFIGAVTDYGICSYGAANATQVIAAFAYLSAAAPS